MKLGLGFVTLYLFIVQVGFFVLSIISVTVFKERSYYSVNWYDREENDRKQDSVFEGWHEKPYSEIRRFDTGDRFDTGKGECPPGYEAAVFYTWPGKFAGCSYSLKNGELQEISSTGLERTELMETFHMSEKDCLAQHKKANFTAAQFPVRISSFTTKITTQVNREAPSITKTKTSSICGKRRDLSYIEFGMDFGGEKIKLSKAAEERQRAQSFNETYPCGDWATTHYHECKEGRAQTQFIYPNDAKKWPIANNDMYAHTFISTFDNTRNEWTWGRDDSDKYPCYGKGFTQNGVQHFTGKFDIPELDCEKKERDHSYRDANKEILGLLQGNEIQPKDFAKDYPMIDNLNQKDYLNTFVASMQPLPNFQTTWMLYGNSLRVKEGLWAAWRDREDFRKFMILGYGIQIGLCIAMSLFAICNCCQNAGPGKESAQLITTIIHFVLVAVTFFIVSLALRNKYLTYHNSFSFLKEDFDSFIESNGVDILEVDGMQINMAALLGASTEGINDFSNTFFMFGAQNLVVAQYMDGYFQKSKTFQTFTLVMLVVSSVNVALVFLTLLCIVNPCKVSSSNDEPVAEPTSICGKMWRTFKEIPHEMKMVAKLMQHSTL